MCYFTVYSTAMFGVADPRIDVRNGDALFTNIAKYDKPFGNNEERVEMRSFILKAFCSLYLAVCHIKFKQENCIFNLTRHVNSPWILINVKMK